LKGLSPAAPATFVAIPVRNEAERIGGCLQALAAQRDVQAEGVVLMLNHCTDATAAIVHGLQAWLPLPLHVFDITPPPSQAHAGTARSLALAHAARLAGPGGVLLTTDADSVAPPDWLGRNLAALRAGADCVCGRAVIDPIEARLIPQHLHEADAEECAFAACLDQITSLLDPDRADPWPRHTEASGASLAVTVSAWQAVGGMAPLPLAEDRGFVARLAAHDMRIRHAPDVWVTVSGRIDGRALGGMADTIRRRLSEPDRFLDARLESASATARRARLRRLARRLRGGQKLRALAALFGLPPARLAALLNARHFGAAWQSIEEESPALRRVPIPVTALPAQMRAAHRLLDRLTAPARGVATSPADSLAVP
jgi:glycosyltransferase involved in cell wall biosynthesis